MGWRVPSHSLSVVSSPNPTSTPCFISPRPMAVRVIWPKLITEHHPCVIFCSWGRAGSYVFVTIFNLFNSLLMLLLCLGHIGHCINIHCTDVYHICGGWTFCIALSGLGQSPLCHGCWSNAISPISPQQFMDYLLGAPCRCAAPQRALSPRAVFQLQLPNVFANI